MQNRGETKNDDDPEEAYEGARAALVDRALDDLQATLTLRWARIRYLASAICIAITFLIVEVQLGTGERLGFLPTLIAFPTILLVGVFFAPILRDVIDGITARQR